MRNASAGDHPDRTQQEVPTMSTHIYGLTAAALTDASFAARTVDHPITLVDEMSQVIVVVDQRGRVTMRQAR
jgi:hypothetical protein